MLLKTSFGEFLLKKEILDFKEFNIKDIFSKKNNETLKKCIEKPRYKKLSLNVYKNYSDYLDMNLGDYLFQLKNENDIFFNSFLNSNGDLEYTKFELNKNSKYLGKKGLYFFYINNELKYIGRCRDNFKKRINTGYGNISPKNCFLDGQSTNCRINNLINTYKNSVTFYILEIENEEKIISLEKKLINELDPEWNL